MTKVEHSVANCSTAVVVLHSSTAAASIWQLWGNLFVLQTCFASFYRVLPKSSQFFFSKSLEISIYEERVELCIAVFLHSTLKEPQCLNLQKRKKCERNEQPPEASLRVRYIWSHWGRGFTKGVDFFIGNFQVYDCNVILKEAGTHSSSLLTCVLTLSGLICWEWRKVSCQKHFCWAPFSFLCSCWQLRCFGLLCILVRLDHLVGSSMGGCHGLSLFPFWESLWGINAGSWGRRQNNCRDFRRSSSIQVRKQAIAHRINAVLKPFSFLLSRYIQVLWALEIAETHAGRAHSAAFDHCSADLQVK